MRSGLVMAMRTDEKTIVKKLAASGQQLVPQFYNIPSSIGRSIHAVRIQTSDSLPTAVLVHGSPGSMDAYLNFLADTLLSARFNLIALDRPGFGYSSGFGKAEGSLQAQAEAVYAALKQLVPDGRAILMGHSLGGPIITRLAMDRPEAVEALAIVAGSVDPANEAQPWWQPVVDNPPVSWLIPLSLVTSNREIMPLRKQLEEMLGRWKDITCPVSIIHAVDDRLVPIGNAYFAKQMLAHNPDVKVEILPTGDHFILWSRHELMRQTLLDLANRVQSK